MADIYTVTQLGRTQSMTPEGFLLCRDVCVARCSPMLYGAHELPNLEPKNGVITVTRDADEIFTPEMMASLEGKPVIITHAGGTITPDNIEEHGVGHVLNVRRGEKASADELYADLLITKRRGIQVVRGKSGQEVSLGYVADYDQQAPGKARQVAILVNHLALVDVGRCGPSCAIGDAAMKINTKKPRLTSGTKRQLALDAAFQKARTATLTRDEEGLAEALGEIEAASELDDGQRSNAPSHEMGVGEPGVNLTINVNGNGASAGGGGGDPLVEDDLDLGGEGGEGPADAAPPGLAAAIAQALAPIQADIAALKDALGLGGDDPADNEETDGEEPLGDDDTSNDEDEDPMTKDQKFTMDAAAVRSFHHDVMAKAAILIPGAKALTLDGKMTVRQAYDATCNYRKAAVHHAATAPATAGFIQPMLNGRDAGKLTCDQAGVIFDAAATLARSATNGATVASLLAAGQSSAAQAKSPQTMADRIRQMNEASRKRYDAGLVH